VLSDGIVKREAPGSLWQPAPTSAWPDWQKVPLSFGLIMSGFSAHPIIPSLNKDLKDPRHFPLMLDLAYVAATAIYLSMGVVGYLLFGRHVSSEITQDLSRTPGYPAVLNKIAIWMIVVSALSKFALAVRPINTTVELLFGVEKSQEHAPPAALRRASSSGKLARAAAARRGRSPPASGADSAIDILAAEPPAPDADGSTTPVARAEDVNPLAGSAISLRAGAATAAWAPRSRAALRAALRIAIAALVGLTAIVLPGFEKVMAFLGAFLAFSTCVFGPVIASEFAPPPDAVPHCG
jgi:vesicular inhibitory amino acid transporter